MITKWYKNLLMWALQSGITAGYTPVKNVTGNTKYLGGNFNGFPYGPTKTVQINSLNNAGIYVGTGQTPATEEDYSLENKIASGLTPGTVTTRGGVDENGNPYIEYTFMLSNTTANDIIIKEIGYYQNVSLASTIGGSMSSEKILIDRTVLPTPVTVPANGEAVLRYTLKTVFPS